MCDYLVWLCKTRISCKSKVVYIKTDDISKDLAKDVETRFSYSNNELNRHFSKGKNKSAIGLIKIELGRKLMSKFVGLRTKT